MLNQILFSPHKIGNLTAPNRFVAQPMEINAAGPGGCVSPEVRQRYLTLARGNWGIIILEALSITSESLARKHQLVINEKNLPALQDLIAEMKKVSPSTLLLLQITHSGVESSPDFSKCVSVWPAPTRRVGDARVHTLTDEEIAQISGAFIHCFTLAEITGADGIDFKVCHGYLGAEFLRPANVRPGQYGGNLENRFRFFRDTVQSYLARRKNSSFVFGTRFSFYEGVRGGFGTAGRDSLAEDATEPLAFVNLCKELRIDYVNVSAGIPSTTPDVTRPGPKTLPFLDKHFKYQRLTKQIAGSMAVIGSGYSATRINLPAIAAGNISEGVTDFVGLGRQNLADPEYPKKFLVGERALNVCPNCGGCSELLRAQEIVGCVGYNKDAAKRLRDLRKRVKIV
jgi:2,4-dienoyl-CoA reductase-like NADH-dependent reductase (Old Yellow Enzyme family)